jgi:hypothetical protein
VTLIETKERKVMVMSAKPSDVPNIVPQPVTAQPPKSLANQKPSFNDAFSQFLNVQKKVPPVPISNASGPQQKIVVQSKQPVNVTARITVQSTNQDRLKKAPEAVVSVVQQQKQQRVTTEKIQPYGGLQGGNSMYAIQQNLSGGNNQQVFYTLSNPNVAANSPRQVSKQQTY